MASTLDELVLLWSFKSNRSDSKEICTTRATWPFDEAVNKRTEPLDNSVKRMSEGRGIYLARERDPDTSWGS